MKENILKILFLPFVLLYMNSVVLCFFIKDLTNVSKLLPIIIINIVFGVDIIIRNRSKKEDRYNRIIVIAAFLIFPVLIAAPYIESKLFLSKEGISLNAVVAVGILLEVMGGLILIYSRISIGKYGTTSIAIEENHFLITAGIYKYSRNPIYFGIIVLFFGYGISVNGFISTGILVALICIICLSRIKVEEKLLEDAFGIKYSEYKKKTKRLIPFIY